MQHPKCQTCGIMIRWQATIVEGRVYCCLGCAQGGPCECDYGNLPQKDEAKALVRRPVYDLLQRGEDS